MSSRIEILSIPIWNVTMDETRDFVFQCIAEGKPGFIATANAEMVMKAQTDVELARILQQADMTYINAYIPCYTNILYQIVPVQIWTIIGVGQYLIPVIVLMQIKVPPKSWFYVLLYPLFIYSWAPVTFMPYRIIFIVLVAMGAFLKLDVIWILADIVNGLMMKGDVVLEKALKLLE